MSIDFNLEMAPSVNEVRRITTLVDLLRMRALAQPDRNAYTFIKDDEQELSWTYGELDRRARSIAASLQTLNAQGERVLLLYPPGLEYIAGFFGCLYAGAIAVPTYPPRLNHSLERLLTIVADSQATVILSIGPILTKLESICSQLPIMTGMRWLASDSVSDIGHRWLPPVLHSEHTAFLQYTSGSTSTPKGVIVSHANLLHNERMIQRTFGQTEDSTIVGWLPLYHDMGLIGNVLQTVYSGARCVLMSPTAFLQRPLRWLETISRYQATTSGGPNFAYELCVRRSGVSEDLSLDLSSWNVAFNGAETVRAETIERFAAAFGRYGFRREAFHPCYGLAEATLLVAGKRPTHAPSIASIQERALEQNTVIETLASDHGSRSLVSCGATAVDQRLVIVDPESLTACPAEKVGEVWVAGPSVAHGYWNAPDETARTFRARLANDSQKFFLRTGDLGFVLNGELFLTGRLKDLIIIRGLNHYPQDIELTVEESHAALRRGCGAAFSVDVDGEERLVIVQELEHRLQINVNEIVESIRQAVSEKHELETHSIVLIKKGSLPKTSSGKIQRRACRALFLAGELDVVEQWQAAGAGREATASAVLQNPDDVESWLVSQLASRLRLDEAQLDVNQPIARYGLDSLMAIELMHGIESGLGISLPMVSFLQSPTISQLAAQVRVQLSLLAAAPKKNIAPVAEKVVEHSLSYGQRSLWFMHELAPHSSVYNIASAIRIRAQLDVAALRSAFQTLVDRHSCLRTTFAAVDGEPIQRVAEHVELDFEETDASLWSEASLHESLETKAHLPFDLEQGPLVRISIFKRSAAEHVLLFNVHHIVADFWSLAVLMHELGVIYAAQKASTPVTLPPLTLKYEDYVYRQAGMLAGPAGEQLWNFWQEQLAGELPVLNLPLDRPRRLEQSHRGASRLFAIEAELTRRLRDMSAAHDATLYMTLLAAFQILLHRYTGQEKILVGSPTAGRSWAELAGVVGYFVNPIVLQADLAGNPTVSEFLGSVRQTALQSFEHQDYPFSLLVERLCPVRDASVTPLVQAIFAFQRAHLLNKEGLSSFALGETGSRVQLGELELEYVGLQQQVTQFDLTLTVAEPDEGLSASLQYNTDIFDAATIARMASNFQRLLEGIVSAPQQRICSLPVLTAAENRQVLVEWNQTVAEYPLDQCVHQLFEAQARRAPEAVAVVCGDEQLSYRELDQRANQLAHHLKSLDAGPETLVAICVERSIEMLVGLLGILKAGAAYVPLDATYPSSRLSLMMEDSRARVVITQERLVHVLPETTAPVICLDRDWETIAQQSEEKPIDHIGAGNLAYVIYTSGSTGRPKGVQIEHGSLLNLVFWHLRTYDIQPPDRATQVAGLGFDASVWEVWPYLAAGASIYLPDEETRTSPEKLKAWLVAEDITISFLPTPLAENLLSTPWPESALRFLLTGGDRLGIYPPASLSFKLVNHYGPTENTVVATATTVEPKDDAEVVPPIGRGIANTEVYLLDQNLEPVPLGVAGEIYLGGQSLARGYLSAPEMTAERFVPHAFSDQPGKRLYRTGDLGRYLADGQLEFLGRRDHQVKLRGFRIELGEIEAALSGHEAVGEAVVMVVGQLVGCVRVVREVSSSELRAFLKQKLPEYMVPVLYVLVKEFPLTENGKVDRGALAELAARAESVASRGGYVAARNPTEEVVVEIWQQVLKVERVGVEDNFFELGGHSLLATRVMARVQASFQVDLPLRALFEEPTVAGLAANIENARRAESGLQIAPIQHVSRDEDLPLSFSQHRLWFLDQLDSESHTYNIAVAIQIDGPLDTTALEHSLSEVVRRHEILRTVFTRVGGEPVQVINDAEPLALPVIDLQHLPESERMAEATRLSTVEAQHRFDLARGPLFRATLLRLSDDKNILLVNVAHIISDGWSMEVLVREVAALYDAFVKNEPASLPELPIQYADFAQWQRQWLQGEFLDAQLGYWREQLAGAPALLALPTNRPRPAVQSFKGNTQSLNLSETLTDAIRSLGRSEDATLFMTLFAAFNALLYRYTNQKDLVVGVPVSNRNWLDLEKLIGFFVNTLVLRTDLSGEPTFRELLRRVREVALGAYTRQDLPFERLVEELQPERDLSSTPLFQVMFALQNAPLESLDLSGLSLNICRIETGTSKFDLTLTIQEHAHELACLLEYNTDLFDDATIQRMLAHWQNLLESLVAAPDKQISDFALLDENERQQLLVDWQQTQKDYPQDLCIHELFEAQVIRTPDATAVVSETASVSYSELNERANQLGHHLRSLSTGPEIPILICLSRSVEMIVALLAVMKTGAAYVPLDPRYPQERLAYMIENSCAPVLITETELLDSLPSHSAHVVCVDRDAAIIEGYNRQNLSSTALASNLAYVIYTSGSTGRPKGVAIEHRSAVTLIHWAKEVFTSEELSGVLASTSICFDLSVFEMFVPLSWGGTVIIAENALQISANNDVRLVNTVPSAAAELLRLNLLPASVHTINLAGEALSNKLVQQLYEQEMVQRVFNLYGPTEDTTYSTYALMEKGSKRPTPIGCGIANTDVYVLDQNLEPVPLGVAGEIYLGGQGLARGYLSAPEMTAERFVPHPYSEQPGRRLYRTGDLGRYVADGQLEYLGRRDHQVKLRGFRIELGEIEAALSGHEAVEEAVVMVTGEQLVGCVRGHEVSSTELRAFLKQKLPEYMVPGLYLLVKEFPLTANGKVDRGALAKLAAQAESLVSEVGYVAARTPTEEVVVEIWQQVLKVERVGVEDNFFDLGGHSLLATRVIAMLMDTFKVDVPLRAIFETPTVAAVADIIDTLQREESYLPEQEILPISRDQFLTTLNI